VAATSWISD